MKIPPITSYVTTNNLEYAVFGERAIMAVGLYYTNDDDNESDRQEAILQLEPGDTLELIREPGNTYDPNAVCLATYNFDLREPERPGYCTSRRVGYIPGEIVRSIAPLMDAYPDWTPRALITEMKEGKNGTWFKFKVISERGQAERLVSSNAIGIV
jgi:hypothetical protein